MHEISEVPPETLIHNLVKVRDNYKYAIHLNSFKHILAAPKWSENCTYIVLKLQPFEIQRALSLCNFHNSPREVTFPFFTDFVGVVFAKELHAHHSEDEDNNAKDEGQIGQGADGIGHDCQDVVQRLPGFGQLEDAKQTEGSEHGQAFDTFSQKLHQRKDHNEEIEAIPTILEWKNKLSIISTQRANPMVRYLALEK